MIDTLIDLIARLSDIIARETLLLDALELPKAGALVGEKLSALKALQAAYMELEQSADKPDDAEREAALGSAIQLLERLGEANRAAIERGLALQMRLIQTIVQAVPRARAAQAPVYQHDGRQLPPRPPEAFAFLSRM
jgi:hypothetical protein